MKEIVIICFCFFAIFLCVSWFYKPNSYDECIIKKLERAKTKPEKGIALEYCNLKFPYKWLKINNNDLFSMNENVNYVYRKGGFYIENLNNVTKYKLSNIKVSSNLNEQSDNNYIAICAVERSSALQENIYKNRDSSHCRNRENSHCNKDGLYESYLCAESDCETLNGDWSSPRFFCDFESGNYEDLLNELILYKTHKPKIIGLYGR